MFGILEDDLDGRRPRMLRALHPLVPVCHDNSPDFLAWLRANFDAVRILSLDHDLGPSRVRDDGERWEPGTGMDVVDYLVTRKPAFPVIVHSSNPVSVPTMLRCLQEAGWSAHRAVPLGDDWIERDWLSIVRTLLPR